MTRSETIGIIELIRRAYPRFVEPSPFEPDIKTALSGVVDLWEDMLSDCPLETVTASVRRYIATGKFPPTIADIRMIAAELTTTRIQPADIWQEAYMLLNSGIPANQAERAYERMSPACKNATLAAGGWYSLSMSDEGDAHVRRAFLQAAERYLSTERRQTTAGTLPENPATKRIGGDSCG